MLPLFLRIHEYRGLSFPEAIYAGCQKAALLLSAVFQGILPLKSSFRQTVHSPLFPVHYQGVRE